MLLQNSGHALGAAALALVALLPAVSEAVKLPPPTRLSFGPDYRGVERCPQRCSLAGPHSGNWSLYHNLEQTDACRETLFLDFSLYDGVDDASTYHRIFACTSFGADWTNTDARHARQSVVGGNASTWTTPTPVTYQLGWDADTGPGLATADIRSMSRQLRAYLAGGFRTANESVVLFAKSDRGTLGVYMGRGLDNARTGEPALRVLEAALQQYNTSSSVTVQLCDDYIDATGDRDHIFGVMAASDGSFAAVQQALQTWYNGSCVRASSFTGGTANYSSEAVYLTPRLLPQAPANVTGTNTTFFGNHTFVHRVQSRDTCRTIDVVDGDTCEKLAAKCGIQPHDFTQYNSDSRLCSSLLQGMHVCCSAGPRPNYRPSRNADGRCATHTVGHGETCTSLAAAFDLRIQEIDDFNRRTWMFNGCDHDLYYQGVICLSDGDPPMPAPVDGAQCGPQKPGTPRQPPSVDLNTVNPCPINACCDIWGSCGTSPEYCTDTHLTAAPGSAAPNTAGCISNCGTDLIKSAPPAQFLSVGYYEGYQFDRSCLFQVPKQIDTSKYTHIHYAFATIQANDYTINTDSTMASYAFMAFRRLTGVKRIVSLGGWGFSTSPNTYNIFRQGVKAGNREKLAANVAQFVKTNNLDGVDFDWEYPGAYDIPGIPAPVDGKDEGPDYLEFLKLVRQQLPDKSISIAVSSSYWYLRNFPIADMGRVVDYVVYMTYDLHGQWDAATKWSQSGCGDGKCLRSHVNLTETLSSLVMVTKAGVPSNKIVVGVSSYGRSFNMVDGGCWTDMCRYTGTATQSDATPGVCTGVGGYIADAEIKQILASPNRIRTSYHDGASDSNILVYDNNQWVSYMDNNVRAARTKRYQQLNLGGTANWAIDLEDYHDTPPYEGASSWSGFILGIQTNGIEYPDGYFSPRHNNWTSITCDDPAVSMFTCYSPERRWSMLDADDAWADARGNWNTSDASLYEFSSHVSNVFHMAERPRCSSIKLDANCDATVRCSTGDGSGAAGYIVWNSIITIHQTFADYYATLIGETRGAVMDALTSFENTFAPVTPPENTAWMDILWAVISLGLTAVAAPFFNGAFSKLAYFAENGHTLDNLKDATYAAIASGAIISGTEMKNSRKHEAWTAADQAQFSTYLGQVIWAWANATSYTLAALMSGNDDSISRLTALISNGKMITGGIDTDRPCRQGNPDMSAADTDPKHSLTANTTRLIFASAIPDLWRVSGLRPFVLDAGYPCNAVDPLPDYMSAATMHATYGCYQDRLYYLVMPKGRAVHCDQDLCNLGTCSPGDCHQTQFVAPTGLDQLVPGNAWGDLSRQDLITGSVRTYLQNNRQNDGGPADMANRGTMDDLLGGDFTTPGVMRIPVCSPDMAYKAWELGLSPDTTPHYPCAPPPTTASNCGDSSFVDQTSNASPPVADCLQIVNNIEGTTADYPVFSDQQGILSAGLCVFGVQGKRGVVGTRIANQDAIDLIRDAVAKFGGSGKIGAKGTMTCGGNTVEWGIYHRK